MSAEQVVLRYGVDLDEILRCEVGSGLHGIAIEGTDDHDEMGIFVEPPEVVLGLKPGSEHRVRRTQPEGVRSGPGDVDLVQYSLRKYMRLAVAGNPTIILPLFAPSEKVLFASPHGIELRAIVGDIVSRQAGPKFLGYMDSQIARFEGRKKMPTTRQELIDKYGYDTKFASHAMRLGLQGIQLMRDGTLTLPMQGWELHWVREVKQGRWSKEDVVSYVVALREELRRYVDGELPSPLNAEPNWDFINWWMVSVHQMTWGYRAWPSPTTTS